MRPGSRDHRATAISPVLGELLASGNPHRRKESSRLLRIREFDQPLARPAVVTRVVTAYDVREAAQRLEVIDAREVDELDTEPLRHLALEGDEARPARLAEGVVH